MSFIRPVYLEVYFDFHLVDDLFFLWRVLDA
jgi:hypothetical protein